MRRLLAVLLLSLSVATSGCTIAGAAVGSAMPRYERAEWPRDHVAIGTQVRVRVRNIGADAIVAGAVDGRYGGIRDGLLSVTDEAGREHEMPVRDVVAVEVRSGTQWKKGLLIGAAADAIVAVTAIAIANGADVSIATAP